MFSPFVFVVGLTLGRTRLVITPAWYKGGGGGLMEPLPRVFVNVALFLKDLTFSQILQSSPQDEVYFIDSSTAGGLYINKYFASFY